ncbi:MAG: hypothetical protein AABX16_02300 [Nanoarchaeota archaeon]
MTHTNYQPVRNAVKNAFKELRKKGLVARMNYGDTATSTSHELAAIMEEKNAIGFTYFNEQDEKDLREKGSVCIGYGGATDWYENIENIPENGLTNLEAGELVSEALRRQNTLQVIWGKVEHRKIIVDLRRNKQ